MTTPLKLQIARRVTCTMSSVGQQLQVSGWMMFSLCEGVDVVGTGAAMDKTIVKGAGGIIAVRTI
jgi:cytochrome c oxidase assembly factor CtaG